MLTDYRSRLSTLPTAEALRAMLPGVSDRMRKRRCFADSEVDAAMLERERCLAEVNRLRAMSYQPHWPPVLRPSCYPSSFVQNGSSPKAILLKMFPGINPNVMELVYQGCGGNIEKTIQHFIGVSHKGFNPSAGNSVLPPSISAFPHFKQGYFINPMAGGGAIKHPVNYISSIIPNLSRLPDDTPLSANRGYFLEKVYNDKMIEKLNPTTTHEDSKSRGSSTSSPEHSITTTEGFKYQEYCSFENTGNSDNGKEIYSNESPLEKLKLQTASLSIPTEQGSSVASILKQNKRVCFHSSSKNLKQREEKGVIFSDNKLANKHESLYSVSCDKPSKNNLLTANSLVAHDIHLHAAVQSSLTQVTSSPSSLTSSPVSSWSPNSVASLEDVKTKSSHVLAQSLTNCTPAQNNNSVTSNAPQKLFKFSVDSLLAK